jgi:hypothetical protein
LVFFIRPSISLPGTKPKSASDDRDFALAGLLQEKSWGRLGPQWIRPTPPRLHILDGELQWLNPDNNHELLWDYSMCADTSRGAAIRDLIARALKGPLAPSQQEVLCYILVFMLAILHLWITNKHECISTINWCFVFFIIYICLA